MVGGQMLSFLLPFFFTSRLLQQTWRALYIHLAGFYLIWHVVYFARQFNSHLFSFRIHFCFSYCKMCCFIQHQEINTIFKIANNMSNTLLRWISSTTAQLLRIFLIRCCILNHGLRAWASNSSTGFRSIYRQKKTIYQSHEAFGDAALWIPESCEWWWCAGQEHT